MKDERKSRPHGEGYSILEKAVYLGSGLISGVIGNYLGRDVIGSAFEYFTGKDESVLFGLVFGSIGIGVGVIYSAKIVRTLIKRNNRFI